MSTRAERLIAAFDGAGIDLLLVTDLVNVRYLTGYTGSNGLALIGHETRVFITDFRYTEQAEQEVGDEFQAVTAERDLITAAAALLPAGEPRLGFEAEHTSIAAFERSGSSSPSGWSWSRRRASSRHCVESRMSRRSS